MSLDKMNATPEHPAIRLQRLAVQPNSPQLSPEQRRRFGRKFHMERLAAGCTQEQVAAAMGLYGRHGLEFVERLEVGSFPEVELTRTRARAIERRLGIPANQLLNEIAGDQDIDDPFETDEQDHDAEVSWIGRGPTTAVDRRIQTLAVLGSLLGGVLAIAALTLFITAHPVLAAAALISAGTALSFPLALAAGRAMETRNRLG